MPERRARGRTKRSQTTRRAPPRSAESARWLLVFAGLLALATLAYRPALDGPFFSDDLHYVATNPYVQQPTPARVLELFDPTGEPVRLVENYAPVHLLLHAGAVALFGDRPLGHHVLNVVLHALAAALLAALFARSGLPFGVAVAGAAIFLLHPANVEAVAWISQLKSSSALVLSLAALLLFPGRPLAATVAFALSLLAKPTAAFALPVLLVGLWIRRSARPAGTGRELGWAALWVLLFAGFAWAEIAAARHANAPVVPILSDAGARLRGALALVLRYATMALTTRGLSAFHEPEPALSLADPRWLGGLAVLTVLGWRALYALRARRQEAVYWVWAAVSFLPVSQLLPFRFPLADRYLYFILPGLIGGGLLAASGLWARVSQRGPARLAAVAVALLLLVGLGARSVERARLWRSPALLSLDAARRYPEGVSAQLLRARGAADRGDAVAAATALRAALARGYDRFDQLLPDASFARLRDEPEFQAVVREMAARWLTRYAAVERPSQAELLSIALAHQVRGEHDRARRAIQRGRALGGPLGAELDALERSLPAR